MTKTQEIAREIVEAIVDTEGHVHDFAVCPDCLAVQKSLESILTHYFEHIREQAAKIAGHPSPIYGYEFELRKEIATLIRRMTPP